MRQQSLSFESKFEILPVIWQSLPKAIPEVNQRFWLQDLRPSSWGSSGTAWAGRTASTNTGHFLVGGSCCRQRQACLRKTCYCFCRNWLSLRVKIVIMVCRYKPATSLYFSCEMKFSMESATGCCRPKQHPFLCLIFLSVIGLSVKIWHRNKTSCSEENPVQSSRSKLTTCMKKGCLLRFELNSTATLE